MTLTTLNHLRRSVVVVARRGVVDTDPRLPSNFELLLNILLQLLDVIGSYYFEQHFSFFFLLLPERRLLGLLDI